MIHHVFPELTLNLGETFEKSLSGDTTDPPAI